MWQSPRWAANVDTVYAFTPRHPLLNHRVILALRLLARRRRYRVVQTTGNQASLYYGLACALLGLPSKQVVSQLYLDERRGLGRMLDPLVRLVLRRAYGVVVSSRGEAPLVEQRFGLPQERMRFAPFHTNVVEPEDLGCREGHVFAGGRNFRDYETLVEAVRGIDRDVVIVCGEGQLRDRPLPSNVRVEREVPYERYLALLRGASVVVVPLSTEFVPSGQVAILEAMGYGKPVITTRSIGTIDYVRHEVDGLLYALRDAVDLRGQIERMLGDERFRERAGHAAFERVLDEFTFDRHVELKLRMMRELASSGSSVNENRAP